MLAHDGADAELSRHGLRLILLTLLELERIDGVVGSRWRTVLANELTTVLFLEHVLIDLAVDVAPGGRLVQERTAEVYTRVIYGRAN